jgi:hypothetical protein
MTQVTNEQSIRQVFDDLEDGVQITAGSLNAGAFFKRVEQQRTQSQATNHALWAAFGRFINIARRERTLSIGLLAEQAETSALDLFLIEEGLHAAAPAVVARLAHVLDLPPDRLMQLVGYGSLSDEDLLSAAFLFVERAGIKPLEPQEKAALDEFVKILAAG